MTETMHTTGPWTAQPEYEGSAATYVCTPQGQAVADCSFGWPAHEEMANARLIAAAPDLLEALRLMLEWRTSGLAPRDQMYAMDLTRAAIDKATRAAPVSTRTEG